MQMIEAVIKPQKLDAVKSGFARWDGEPWDRVTWRFPGEIEECGEDPDACEESRPNAARR